MGHRHRREVELQTCYRFRLQRGSFFCCWQAFTHAPRTRLCRTFQKTGGSPKLASSSVPCVVFVVFFRIPTIGATFRLLREGDQERLCVPCTPSVSRRRSPRRCGRSASLGGMASAAAVGSDALAPLEEDAVDAKVSSERGWGCRIAFGRVCLLFRLPGFGPSWFPRFYT